jgi:hypothetical protein
VAGATPAAIIPILRQGIIASQESAATAQQLSQQPNIAEEIRQQANRVFQEHRMYAQLMEQKLNEYTRLQQIISPTSVQPQPHPSTMLQPAQSVGLSLPPQAVAAMNTTNITLGGQSPNASTLNIATGTDTTGTTAATAASGNSGSGSSATPNTTTNTTPANTATNTTQPMTKPKPVPKGKKTAAATASANTTLVTSISVNSATNTPAKSGKYYLDDYYSYGQYINAYHYVFNDSTTSNKITCYVDAACRIYGKYKWWW